MRTPAISMETLFPYIAEISVVKYPPKIPPAIAPAPINPKRRLASLALYTIFASIQN